MMDIRADIYRNLHKDCYSLKCMDTTQDYYPYGRVFSHEDRVLIDDPEFVVQPAGLAETRETGVKTVHAFVRGTVVETGDAVEYGAGRAWAFDYRPLDERHLHRDRPFIFHDPPDGRPIDHFASGPDQVLLTEYGQYGLFDYTLEEYTEPD